MKFISLLFITTVVSLSAHSITFIKSKNGEIKFLPSSTNIQSISKKNTQDSVKYKVTADVMYIKLNEDAEQVPTSICKIDGEVSYLDIDKGEMNFDMLSCNGVLNNKNITVELQPTVAHYKNGKNVIQSFYHYFLVKESNTQAVVGSRDSQSQTDLINPNPISTMDKSALINLSADQSEFIFTIINFKKINK